MEYTEEQVIKYQKKDMNALVDDCLKKRAPRIVQTSNN